MNSIKKFSELKKIPTFEGRYDYLHLSGNVGDDTFGFERYLNQKFYKSLEWRRVRDFVIVRDNACDLSFEGMDIGGRIIIHHLNPITIEDIENSSDFLLNPEYLVCVSEATHNAIHYGDSSFIKRSQVVERSLNDTAPWKFNKKENK